MKFRKEDIIFLLGAGCSKDAGIATSEDMIKNIEQLIQHDSDWKKFEYLYNYIKSAILYSDGIRGIFDSRINIERLVNALSELSNREENTIYPFIGNWNTKLIELAGDEFKNIKSFKQKIFEKLKKWVTLKDYRCASYYSKMINFRKSCDFYIRIFSLNYDLCLEKNKGDSYIELGFNEDTRKWDWNRFQPSENLSPDFYLYKMHGSIEWKRDDNGNLTYSEEVGHIEEHNIIFGTNYKLQYIDPYLFYAYEFRHYSLIAKLIITIGYSFGDDHINGIMGQSLKNDPNQILLCVLLGKEDEEKPRIQGKLGLRDSSQIVLKNMTAKKFMEEELTIEKLQSLFPSSEEIDWK